MIRSLTRSVALATAALLFPGLAASIRAQVSPASPDAVASAVLGAQQGTATPWSSWDDSSQKALMALDGREDVPQIFLGGFLRQSSLSGLSPALRLRVLKVVDTASQQGTAVNLLRILTSQEVGKPPLLSDPVFTSLSDADQNTLLDRMVELSTTRERATAFENMVDSWSQAYLGQEKADPAVDLKKLLAHNAPKGLVVTVAGQLADLDRLQAVHFKLKLPKHPGPPGSPQTAQLHIDGRVVIIHRPLNQDIQEGLTLPTFEETAQAFAYLSREDRMSVEVLELHPNPNPGNAKRAEQIHWKNFESDASVEPNSRVVDIWPKGGRRAMAQLVTVLMHETKHLQGIPHLLAQTFLYIDAAEADLVAPSNYGEGTFLEDEAEAAVELELRQRLHLPLSDMPHRYGVILTWAADDARRKP